MAIRMTCSTPEVIADTYGYVRADPVHWNETFRERRDLPSGARL
jgi:hypothetical protein